jgi:signal transduction histidine kinase
MEYFILSIVVIAINLALLFFITLTDSRGKIFNITLLGAIIWALSLNLLYSGIIENFIEYDINLYLVRISFLGAIITVTGLVLFERSYLRDKSWNNILYWTIIFILGYIFIFTPSVVKEVIVLGNNNYKFEYGFLYIIYGIFYIALFLKSYISIVFRFFNTSKKIEKLQLRFFLIGISLSFWIGIFTNLIYPTIFGSSDLSKFGPLGMVFVGIFTTYAIFKHHLFNIKMILAEILLGLMGIILFIYIFLSASTYEFVVSIIFFIIFIILAYNFLKELLKGIKREKELNLSNRKLAETIESKDLFLRMTSHQLRTPLTSLNGFLSLILEQWQGKYKMNEYTRDDIIKVYINVQRLVESVNDVLSLNSIRAGRFGIFLRPQVNIKDELTYLIQDNKYILDHFNTKIILKTIGDDFVASVDNVRMKNVFQNLLSNAVYYGEDKIWITLIDEGDRLRIRFRDNGKGINKEIKDKIFNPGFRVGGVEDRNPNGSGFGLFISKTIIDMHHGTLKLKDNGSSKGAVFEIKIPKAPPVDKYAN